MGVSGLWDIIGKAGQSQSLTRLAVVNGFEDNGSGKRTYRVGIDASIWFQHAAYSKGGENPELRLLFFRLKDWAELPFSLIFVFDGHDRPKVKRGSKMGKSGSHNLMAGMKKLLEIFGIEWRLAPGEAEAELAHLNRSGVIDAVLTDDVDALVFGALTIIKNPSLQLTGNRANPAVNLDGKTSKNHVMMYTADAVRTHPQVQLTRAGMVLIALLSGGDYHDGVERFGPGIAYGLARCGFGDRLLEIFALRAQEDIDVRLAQWREDAHVELRTNSRGFLSKRCPSCILPANFPPRDILTFYTSPVTSAQLNRQGGAIRDTGDMSLPRLAAFCENHFGEWGHASAIIKRFRDLIWEAAVMQILRRAALEADEKEKTKRINTGSRDLSIRGPLKPSRDEAVGTPEAFVRRCLDMNPADRRREAFINQGSEAPNPTALDKNALRMEIVGSRQHVSTDRIMEYRIELCPSLLVSLARKGILGKRPEQSASSSQNNDLFNVSFVPASQRRAPKGPSKPPPDPDSVMRMWLPASMIQQVHPELVQNYEANEAAKRSRKAKGKGKARANSSGEDADDFTGLVPGISQVPAMGEARSSQSTSHNATLSRNTNLPPRIPLPHGPSLPTAPKGFLFWFPDPDDPDMLIPEDGLPLHQAKPSIIPPPLQPPSSLFVPSVQTVPQAAGPSSRRPVRSRTVAYSSAPVAATNEHPPLPDNAVEPPRDEWDPFFDDIMGINSERPAKSTSTGNSARSWPANPARSRGKNRGRQTDRANFTYDFADSDDEDIPSRNSNSAPGPSQRSTVDAISSSRASQAPGAARRSIRGRAPGRRTDRANFAYDFSGSEDDNAPPRAGPSHDTEPHDRIVGAPSSRPTPSASAAKRPRQSFSTSTTTVSVPPAPSAEPYNASPTKKSKTTHNSRTYTTPAQLQPNTSQHPQIIPARSPVDPDVIDLSSDSDGPLRHPLPTPVHSVQAQKLMSQRDSLRGRRYIPEPTSSQESGLVDMSDVSVMIDLT